MRMSFSGLEIALSGLYTSQKALSIANHNITNAATPGYTRQVAEIQANMPYGASGAGMLGTGSELTAVNRVRDSYIDYRYWNEAGTSGEWKVKESALADFEMLFNETQDSGFTKVMNEFYVTMQELSKDPSSLPARVSLKEKAISLAKYFNNMSTQLQRLQRDYNSSVRSKVDEINSYSKQIRDLNDQIYKAELDGSTANDLRDKRQLLVDKLSQIVNIDVSERVVGTIGAGTGVADKRFSITINGHYLVNHIDKYDIRYEQRAPADRQNPTDIDGLYDLEWEDGNPLNFSSGELKAYIDVRDGNGDSTTGSENLYKGVPYYMQELNNFVRTFVESLNEGLGSNNGFADGYGLDGSTGIKLFTANSISSAAFTNYTTLTAENIGVSEDILGSDGLKKIPASNVYGQSGNSKILEAVLNQRHDASMFSEGAPEDFMKSLIATMAVDAQESVKMNQLQESILDNIENKRDSVSGVSIDEEMTNVVKFQQIYTASAKLISIMDELYDITVNRLGSAGR